VADCLVNGQHVVSVWLIDWSVVSV